MKPWNFPGRKRLRRERALEIARNRMIHATSDAKEAKAAAEVKILTERLRNNR